MHYCLEKKGPRRRIGRKMHGRREDKRLLGLETDGRIGTLD